MWNSSWAHKKTHKLWRIYKRVTTNPKSAYGNIKLALVILKKRFFKKYRHQPLLLASTKYIQVDSKNIKSLYSIANHRIKTKQKPSRPILWMLSKSPGRKIKSQCLMVKICTGDRDCVASSSFISKRIMELMSLDVNLPLTQMSRTYWEELNWGRNFHLILSYFYASFIKVHWTCEVIKNIIAMWKI